MCTAARSQSPELLAEENHEIQAIGMHGDALQLGALRCSHARRLLEAQFTEACVFVRFFVFTF